MLHTAQIEINEVFLHFVGNPMNDEDLTLSKTPVELSPEVRQALKSYFFDAFKSDELHHFDHDSDLNLNEVYTYARTIFDQPESLAQESEKLAKHLYQSSNHPNVKSGELYVVYLTDCLVEGDIVDGIGLFKSETKDTFLKLSRENSSYDIQTDMGVNIEKLDKGCIIFNSEREDGFLVSVVDRTNKGLEARFWVDEFLHLKPRRDVYFATQNVLSACKNFIAEELPEQYEVDKADQIDLLNRSIDYFKKNETYDQNEFEGMVFQDENVIESFQEYNKQYAEEKQLDWQERFEISPEAVKRKSRIFKSVLKLDKNFHIYIHGNRDWIERGVDEDGRKYYKVYYEQER